MPGGTGMGAFEIDFSMFNIAIGEPVFIVIEHNDGCKPKILNPEVLLPRSTFKVTDISVGASGKLVWKTTDEQGKLPYIVEQYRWNKWVTIGEVQGKGTRESTSYEFQVTPHSGENTVRVTQVDHSGTKRTSKEVPLYILVITKLQGQNSIFGTSIVIPLVSVRFYFVYVLAVYQILKLIGTFLGQVKSALEGTVL
jgi:hypothetical protein